MVVNFGSHVQCSVLVDNVFFESRALYEWKSASLFQHRKWHPFFCRKSCSLCEDEDAWRSVVPLMQRYTCFQRFLTASCFPLTTTVDETVRFNMYQFAKMVVYK